MTNGKSERYASGGVDSGLGEGATDDESDVDIQTTSESTVPHRVRYESPKQNRTEVQFLLDDDDADRLQELESLAKQEFDETVYRTDVKLAGLRAGIQSPENKFLRAMREIGYGYFD